MTTEKLIEHFFASIERGDADALREIYDADAKIWHNFSGTFQTREENITLLSRAASVGTLKFTFLERHVIGDRVAQRHELTLTMHDGRTLKVPAAMFITVRDNRIVALDEYVDSAHVDPKIVHKDTNAVAHA